MGDCVGFLGNPENLGCPRTPPPAGSSVEARDLWPIQEGRPEFRGIATYLGRLGGDSGHRWSLADCVGPRGVQKIPDVRGFARRPGLRRRGAIYGQFRTVGRNSAKSPHNWGDNWGGGRVRASLIIGRLRRIPDASWKSRLSADSPECLFCGGGARFMGNSGRSAGIPRNRHLLWEIGRNFEPRRSLADCV